MEQRVFHQPGGTLSLARLIREHGEAIEFDLIRMGLRLRDVGSSGFNWRDLYIVVKHLDRETETYRELHPDDDTSWTVSDYLLAVIADTTHMRLWQAGGGKGKKPKPIPRPGEVKHRRGDSMSMEEAKAWLGWDEPDAAAAVDLSPEDRARQIKLALSDGEGRKSVAERFHVSLSTVGRIARGEAWAHV